MAEHRDLRYRYKAVETPPDAEGIQTVIEEWQSYGYQLWQAGVPGTVGVMIFRKERKNG